MSVVNPAVHPPSTATASNREAGAYSQNQPNARKYGTATVVVCVLLLLLMYSVTRIEFVPGVGFKIVKPRIVAGDEPHYLMVINSLLFDHDLQLQDDYRRVDDGGLEAGAGYSGRLLDHHSIIVNRRTGDHAVWVEVFGWVPKAVPCSNGRVRCLEFHTDRKEFAASPDVYEVSCHPVAFPALIAGLIAPFRPAPTKVERDSLFVMVILCWLGVIATYFLARQAGFGVGLSTGTALLLLFATPWLSYSRSLYSEPVIGLTLVLALWALEKGAPALSGLCLAAAAYLKPPFGVVAAGVILERLLARRWKDAASLTGVLGVLGAVLLAINYGMAHTFLISGNASWTPAENFYYLYETLLHPEHGVFVFVPWVLFAFAAAKHGLAEHGERSTLLRRIAVPGLLYFLLLAVTPIGPGFSYGPRYWVPLMPWMAIAAVEFVRTRSKRSRVAFAFLVLLSASIAIPGALRYRQIFSKPPSAAWKGL